MPIRNINPIGFRVVVQVKKSDQKTDAGIFLPEGAKEATQESVLAEVLEVASAYDDDMNEEANISGIPLGANVLIKRDAGVRVPWDDSLRIVETSDVLATIDVVDMV